MSPVRREPWGQIESGLQYQAEDNISKTTTAGIYQEVSQMSGPVPSLYIQDLFTSIIYYYYIVIITNGETEVLRDRVLFSKASDGRAVIGGKVCNMLLITEPPAPLRVSWKP